MKGKFQIMPTVIFAMAIAGLVNTSLVLAQEDPFAVFYKGSPTQKAWGIDEILQKPSPDHGKHFEVGDVFVLKYAGENILFIPGKNMKLHGWNPAAITLNKVGGQGEPPVLCGEVEFSHDAEDVNKVTHVFAIGADESGKGVIVQFEDQAAVDENESGSSVDDELDPVASCVHFSMHGGVAHGEND